MPISAAGLAALGMASQTANNVGSGIFGAIHAKKANERNIENWHRQNAYNHPREQMRRLKEAGLNPNLVYGQSASGSTGGADSPPDTEIPDTPFQIGDAMDSILKAQQVKAVSAQIQNTNASTQQKINQNIFQMYKNIEEHKRLPHYEMNAYNEQQFKEAQQTLQWLRVSGEGSMYDAKLAEIAAKIDVAKATLTGIERTNELKRLHVEMRKVGFEPTDELYQRQGLRVWNFAKDNGFNFFGLGKK